MLLAFLVGADVGLLIAIGVIRLASWRHARRCAAAPAPERVVHLTAIRLHCASEKHRVFQVPEYVEITPGERMVLLRENDLDEFAAALNVPVDYETFRAEAL